MVPCPPRRVVACVVLVLALAIVHAARAHALVCDQDPIQNAILVGCPPAASSCVVLSQSAPGGCVLDFGGRAVTFRGTFDVGRSTLDVRAGTLTIEGTLSARSLAGMRGGRLLLATARDVAVTTGRLDASGNSAGQIQIAAGGNVTVFANGTVVARGIESASPNTASGGTVALAAAGTVTVATTIDVTGGAGGSGGSVLLTAGTDVVVTRRIDARGGEGDGGDVDAAAGDDVRVAAPLDVSSTSGGGGGSVRLRAGLDAQGGVKPGGRLDLTANVVADGDGDADSGYDGGDITLAAFGDVVVAASATMRANGGSPDGAGGSVAIEAVALAGVPRGDVTLLGPIAVRGVAAESDGGTVEVAAARDLRLAGALALDGGASGGTLLATAGRHVTVDGVVTAEGRLAFAGGGSVTVRAGDADPEGTATVGRNVDVSAGAGGVVADVQLAGCRLVVGPQVTIDVGSAGAAGGGLLDLAARDALTLGNGGRYLATPSGRINLRHRQAVTPTIGSGVAFAPAATAITAEESTFYPACPRCGDGRVQAGETCDDGNTADGDCCDAVCGAHTCLTPTPTPTLTPTPTGPTRTSTPTRTRTPTPTPALTPTSTRTGPTPTPGLPQIEPRAVLGCATTLGKATSRLVLTHVAALESCSLQALACVQGRSPGASRDACLTSSTRTCRTRIAKAERARATFDAAFRTRCGGDPARVPLALLRAPDLLAFAALEPTCERETGLRLTSSAAIAACVALDATCESERALGVAVPRAADLLGLVAVDGAGTCVPAGSGVIDGVPRIAEARSVQRCQKAIAVAARAGLARQLGVARGCVETLLKCRLAGKDASACAKVAERCRGRLQSLTDPGKGIPARLRSVVGKSCAADAVAIRGAAGLGLDAIGPRCAELGVPALGGMDEVADCVARASTCAATSIVRHALPLVDAELARYGLVLGEHPDCDAPTATVTPTPVGTPEPSATVDPDPTEAVTPPPASTPTPDEVPVSPSPDPAATDAPTGVPTPTPGPDCGNGVLEVGEQCDFGDLTDGDGCDAACRYETLVPGGGSVLHDCIVEWAVVNPGYELAADLQGFAAVRQACSDGDPACDADGAVNDECRFRVAVCLAVADPRLPACTVEGGIARWVLESPRPTSADPMDRANALALLAGFERLASVTPQGSSRNQLVFVPPLQPVAPDNCTATSEIVVPRRGQTERQETLRARATTGGTPAKPSGHDDEDSLVLVCREPAPPP